MKYSTAFIFFIIGFLLQSTLALNFSILGHTPNITLCLVILFSFIFQGKQGLVYGIVFGLLQDIGFSILTGPSALIYFAIGLLIGELRHYLYRDSILNLFIASTLGTGIYYLANWFILMIFRGNYSFFYMVKGLPTLLALHFVLIVILYIAVRKRSFRHPEDRYYSSRKIYI